MSVHGDPDRTWPPRVAATAALLLLLVAGVPALAGADPPQWAPAWGRDDGALEQFPPIAEDPVVAGSGRFVDWIRLTPERFPYGGGIGFWAEWDGGEPLLPDASGVPTVARLQDWRYRFRASFACPRDGQLHAWETLHVAPNGDENRERFEFDADCNWTMYFNGVETGYFPNMTFGSMSVLGGTFGTHCAGEAVGEYSFSATYDGAPIELAGTGFTGRPQVWVAPELTLAATQTRLTPEIPAVTVGGRQLSAHVPPDQTPFAAEVRDTVCQEPVQGIPLAVTFELVGRSGGHDHQAADRPATPFALATVAPAERGTVFTAATGILTGSTNAEGWIGATLTTGEVAGLVRVTGRPGALPAYVMPFAEETLELEVRVQVDLWELLPDDALALVGITNEHLNGHFIDRVILEPLDRYSLAYAAFWQAQNPPRNYVLRINDSSLVWGGKLDIAGQWVGAHAEHRRGRDVDIGVSARDLDVPPPPPISTPPSVQDLQAADGLPTQVVDTVVIIREIRDLAVAEGHSVLRHGLPAPHLHVRFQAP